MNKHNFYYDEDTKKIGRYFAHIGNIPFKTKEEYEQYIKDNNLPTHKTRLFRLAKNALKSHDCLVGSWVEFENYTQGAIIHDERDFSRYTFENKQEVREFLNYYDAQDFHYCQQCFYDGYEGDEIYSTDYQINYWINQFKYPTFNPELENKKFAHFIISYLPDSEIREKRLGAHLSQIACIKEVTPNARIYIVAQNYKEDEYINDPQVTYLSKHEKGVGAMEARNELLKFFYESDYEYGIFSDDDSFIAPTDTIKNFYEELENNTEKFINAKLDICYSRNMQYSPWNLHDVEARDTYSHEYGLFFVRSGWLCWALMRNFKKAYDKEFYQDVTIDPTQEKGFDDTDFCLNLIENGMHSYMCPLFQLLPYNAGEGDSSIFEHINEKPLYRVHNMRVTLDKYLPRDEKGFYDTEAFRVRNGCPPYVILRREKSIVAEKEMEVSPWYAEAKVAVAGMKKAEESRNKYYL